MSSKLWEVHKAKVMKNAHNQTINIISAQSDELIQQSINSNKFQTQANTDFLTQALNRRGFDERLKSLFTTITYNEL